MPLPVQPQQTECLLDKLFHRMTLAGGDDEVVRPLLLEHEPHGLNVVWRIAPISSGFEVIQLEFVLQTDFDSRRRAGDLATDEGLTSPRAFVIKENAVAGKKTVGLTVIAHNIKSVRLGTTIR